MPYVSKKRRKKRGLSTSRKVQNIWLGVLSVLVLGAFVWAFIPKPAPPVTDAGPRPFASQRAKAEDVVKLDTVAPAKALSRLEDASRPFTLAVLGDSTGAPAGGWVEQVGEWVGQTYDRPVSYNSWTLDRDPDGYTTARSISTGAGAAVTVWNGSAAGQKPGYTMEHLAEMVPVKGADVDLVLINHGHNAAPGSLASSAGKLLRQAAEEYPNAAIMTMTQNPERAGYGNESAHKANMASFASFAERNNVPVIDVRSAFEDAPDLDDLLADDVHPNQDGYNLWAETVIAALKDAA